MKKLLLTLVTLCLAWTIVPGSNDVQAKKISSKRLNQLVAKMSLEEKIAQMYLVPSSGNPAGMAAEIKHYQLGGVVLFGADFQNQTPKQLKAKLKTWQKASQIGLFIATDQEGGTVSRLSANPKLTGKKYPAPQELYAKGGLAAVSKNYRQTAKTLRHLGINWNFAPVADVSNDPNSFIYPRTLGQDYQTTAAYIKKVVPAIQSQKVIASLKHFPGYGSAADTHTGFASDKRPLSDFQQNDFLPFEAGIKAKVDTILVAHVVMSAVDDHNPASLSPAVHQLLRQDLHFKGLIVTDDLGMGAIKDFAKGQAVNPDLLAVKAGNDILLSTGYQKGIPAIAAAVRAGEISEGQIDQTVKRIIKLKTKLGILKWKQLSTGGKAKNWLFTCGYFYLMLQLS